MSVIYLSNVRLSFPHLIDPQKTINEQTGKERISFNAEFIMPPNHPAYAEFMKEYQALAVEAWKQHANAVMTGIHNDRKLRCYGTEADKINKKTYTPYDGYVGNVYLTAGRDTQPKVIDPQGKPVDPSNTMQIQVLLRQMYGGCYVNAAIKPWLQDNKFGRGIRCDLVAVQFLKDGEAFGEGDVDVTPYFGAVAAAAPTPQASAPGLPPFMAPQAAPAPVMPGLPSFLQ